MKKTQLIFFTLLFCSVQDFAQSKTNLEKFFELIDNSVVRITKELNPGETISLIVSAPASLDQLKPKVTEAFSRGGFKLVDESLGGTTKVACILNQAKTNYGETEKDGLFGDVVTERIVSLNGIITLTKNHGEIKSIEINESIKDTISVDQIKSIEDASLLFTKGEKPELSFFSNLLEPLLVVGTLVTTIILLFTVRGK